jgi:hypothetical protein
MRRPWPTGGCSAKNKQTNKLILKMNIILIISIATIGRKFSSSIYEDNDDGSTEPKICKSII